MLSLGSVAERRSVRIRFPDRYKFTPLVRRPPQNRAAQWESLE
jgi:hypothetical protein